MAAEQGMRSLVQRLSIALEAPAVTLGPLAAQHDAAAPAGLSSGHGQQAIGPGSRLTSAGGLSSASSSHGAGPTDGMRRSGAGSSSSSAHHRRPSREQGLDGALASKAQR